jgi:hypothetical protein
MRQGGPEVGCLPRPYCARAGEWFQHEHELGLQGEHRMKESPLPWGETVEQSGAIARDELSAAAHANQFSSTTGLSF